MADRARLVRLYGPSVDHDSWSRVARGMRTGLERLGLLAGFYELEETTRDLDDGLTEGSDAHWGVFVGPPSLCGVLVGRGNHERRGVMIAANSTWLPPEVIKTIERVDASILAPSSWAAWIAIEHAPDRDVQLWQHGVSDDFAPDPDAPLRCAERDREPFRVLHMASTIKERKSTEALVRGWAIAKRHGQLPESAALDIVLSGPLGDLIEAYREEAQGDGPALGGITFRSRLNLSERAASALYQCYDIVFQPSRAEGFGLVPLEARASGVPVAVTWCTGHQEHVSRGDPGVLIVPHWGSDQAGDDVQSYAIDDGPGARAPMVYPFDTCSQLAEAYARRAELRRDALAAAPEIRQKWSWEAVCRRWADLHL